MPTTEESPCRYSGGRPVALITTASRPPACNGFSLDPGRMGGTNWGTLDSVEGEVAAGLVLIRVVADPDEPRSQAKGPFRRLREMPALPSQVKVFDAGTAGLSALGYFENCKKAVIVDAVKAGGRVGRVRRFRLQDFDPPGLELSLHAVGVQHLLTALPVVLGPGAMPEFVVIGAEIGAIHPFTDRLTQPLEAAVDRAIRLIRRELYARRSACRTETDPLS